jgi:hypothetical protein
MKFNARDLKKQSTLHWNIITSMPKSPGPARDHGAGISINANDF